MSVLLGSDVGFDSLGLKLVNLVLIVVSCVCREALWFFARIGSDLLDHGDGLVLIIGVLGDIGSQDDLCLFINSSLAVVSLDVRAARNHNP